MASPAENRQIPARTVRAPCEPVTLLLKNLLFAVCIPGLVAGWIPWHYFAKDPAWPGGAWSWHHFLGFVVLATGLTILLHCLWLFATYGRGTPAPVDPPEKLVQRGAYRWVRNPMYLAVLAVVGGQALFYRSPDILVYWICLACCFQLFVQLHEEPALTREFGAMYEDYRRAVPRWLPAVPKPRD
jgi:protein-S-isoprenylcysteine O-methyltransferase Ste14